MNTDKKKKHICVHPCSSVVHEKSEAEVNLITEKIIGAAFTVSNTLGCGFLEKVYENAMVIECLKSDLDIIQQHPIKVYYQDSIVGEYFADLFVENEVVVELKAGKAIEDVHLAQLMNYLKACKLRYGLLINFGKPKVEIKRVLYGY